MQNKDTITDRKSNGTFGSVIIHPDPILAAENLSITIGKRFWSKVQKTDGCWIWTGCASNTGGVIGRGGSKQGYISVRALSWLIHFGAIPQRKRVMTTCGSDMCVNPAHLKLGYTDAPPPFNPNSERYKALLEVDKMEFDHGYSTQDPTLPPGFSMTFRDRFWANVKKTDTCWYWTGALNPDGYGWIGKGWNQPGNVIRVHIASWIIHKGPVPKGLYVLHDCPGDYDHRNCVNPLHLHLGTAFINAHDAMIKSYKRGRGHWNAHLTMEDIADIKQAFADGHNMSEIARELGVSRSHISRIVSNKSWKSSVPGFNPNTEHDYSI